METVIAPAPKRVVRRMKLKRRRTDWIGSAEPLLVTRPELGRLLAVSEQTILRWEKRDDFPKVHIGSRHLRFVLAEVLEWLKSGRSTTKEER